MTGNRRWWWRALAGVVMVTALEVSVVVTDSRADHLRVVLVVALLVAVAGLLVDAAPEEPPSWHLPPERATEPGSSDARTASYLHVLESHVTAREPDATVRDRLAELAEEMLRLRHGLTRADPRADPLLGPELAHTLASPPRRLGVDELDRCVRRIEQL